MGGQDTRRKPERRKSMGGEREAKAETGALLEIRDLSISFSRYERGLWKREFSPVRNVSCRISEGELVAVVGASGSGKSLLAHAIMGILPYNARMSGTIWYDGRELSGERLETLRGNEIALIPQGVSYLDPLMKVGEQVLGGRRGKKARERGRALLARYGLGPETEKLYPFELSGGMAKRVLMAAALMGGPRLIIADEPTPGLEKKTARRVAGHLQEMAGEGAAVLMITHDLELALEVADRLFIFYEGKILEEISPEEFVSGSHGKNEYTRDLYQVLSGLLEA